MFCEEMKASATIFSNSEWIEDEIFIEPEYKWFKETQEPITTWTALIQRCEMKSKKSHLVLKFENLTREWKAETAFTSSTQEIALNSAYQKIIAMGKPAIPLILTDLKKAGGKWFWALRVISENNPVPEASLGNYEEMRSAWLAWGRNNHYV